MDFTALFSFSLGIIFLFVLDVYMKAREDRIADEEDERYFASLRAQQIDHDLSKALNEMGTVLSTHQLFHPECEATWAHDHA